MHYTDFPSSWSSTLEQLDLHTGHAQPPTGAHSPWYTAIMRFGSRGFFLVFLSTSPSNHVALRLELNHPTGTLAARFAHDLTARLQTLGMHAPHIQNEDSPPALIDLTSTDQLDGDHDAVKALLLLLMKVGDYIIALDTHPGTPSPLEIGSPQASDPTAKKAPTGFEVIGAAAPEHTPAPHSPSKAAFETIGAPKTTQRAVSLTTSHVRARADHLLLVLEFSEAGPHPMLVSGFEHMLRTRFDAVVEVVTSPSAQRKTLELTVRPGLTTSGEREVQALQADLERYIKKINDFNNLGVPLKEVIGIEEASSGGSSHAPALDRTTRRDIPSARASLPAPQHEEPSTGLVLGLAPSSSSRALQEPEHTLTPGDFTDGRLRREDATGSLVDVVLRHPGYSDRNMSKVLMLLLSVEHSKAMALIERSPCVIAWGTGRERAHTMKSVIEGAGGKVVLVEPDTFAAS